MLSSPPKYFIVGGEGGCHLDLLLKVKASLASAEVSAGVVAKADQKFGT